MLADTTVVCTLYSAVGLLISAAEKTNKAPLLNFCQLACKLEVTTFFFFLSWSQIPRTLSVPQAKQRLF